MQLISEKAAGRQSHNFLLLFISRCRAEQLSKHENSNLPRKYLRACAVSSLNLTKKESASNYWQARCPRPSPSPKFKSNSDSKKGMWNLAPVLSLKSRQVFECFSCQCSLLSVALWVNMNAHWKFSWNFNSDLYIKHTIDKPKSKSQVEPSPKSKKKKLGANCSTKLSIQSHKKRTNELIQFEKLFKSPWQSFLLRWKQEDQQMQV